MSEGSKEPKPIVGVFADAAEYEALKKSDVDAMVKACRVVLSSNGEMPEEEVEELAASLRGSWTIGTATIGTARE